MQVDTTFALDSFHGVAIGPASGSGSATINVTAGNIFGIGAAAAGTAVLTNNGAGAPASSRPAAAR